MPLESELPSKRSGRHEETGGTEGWGCARVERAIPLFLQPAHHPVWLSPTFLEVPDGLSVTISDTLTEPHVDSDLGPKCFLPGHCLPVGSWFPTLLKFSSHCLLPKFYSQHVGLRMAHCQHSAPRTGGFFSQFFNLVKNSPLTQYLRLFHAPAIY